MDALERMWQGSTAPPDREKPRSGGLGTTGRLLVAFGVILALLILGNMAKGFYTEWLWFRDLGYSAVYVKVLATKALVFVVAAVVFAALFLGNILVAARLAPKIGQPLWASSVLQQVQRISKWSVVAMTVFLSIIFGAIAQDGWLTVLQAINGQPFGVSDPIFSKEVSFYVFSLPFLRMIHGWLMGALIVTLLGVVGLYGISYSMQRLRFDYARRPVVHAGSLLIAVLGLFAWGYRLGMWDLVFSERGVVFGAGYADIHAKLPALWILLAVVIALIGVVAYAIARRRFRWIAYGGIGWIAAAILIGAAFPAVVQRLQVQPSELARETPYIQYNIQFTREAFALDRVEEQPYPAKQMPTIDEITANQTTISNIRLWDHRPLKETYNQIQSIRLYYDFNDVDVDRYTLDGEYRQVMLAARELIPDQLASEAQTWVNRRLQFTHGYGVALSPVNEISAEGLPTLLVKDLPPVGAIEVTRPEIYFGERTDDYVIIGTRTEEFDYPAGTQNVYGSYEGEAGVSLNGFVRRLVYAWQMGDFNILISGELTENSRLLYHRNIRDRIRRIAPFLALDADPYLVITEGRLLWIQDAYTVTNRYPYSQPARGLNYIRNSVKVVVDAYDGTTTFYVADEADALIKTYEAIFPGLFVTAADMPQYLKEHRRYPLDMFDIQSEVYESYHMQDARVFYNKEDLWAVPREFYESRDQPMEPYYVILRLPGEERGEFLLMLPFTPVNKNNTIGWLAARSDGDSYGKLLAYHFPKERLVFGPKQIEDRIQQDTDITEQLALWGRGGSNVIRGNLLLVPVGDSNLYVEPVFLQATAGGLPELKRVIVAAGDEIAMEPSLEGSLAAIFGTGTSLEPEEPVAGEPPAGVGEPPEVVEEIASLIQEAQQHYETALQFQRDGDWAAYGRELDELQAVLQQLAEAAEMPSAEAP